MNLSKGIPLEDRVLIKPKTPEEKVGDFYLGEKDIEKPVEGEVISVGPGAYSYGEELMGSILEGINVLIENKGLQPIQRPYYQAMKVKPGDYVLYGRHAGTKLSINGETYLMIRQSDIFMIIEKEVDSINQ